MRIIRAILGEVWGLFVDDGRLALALLLCCVAAGVLAAATGAALAGAVLLAGCLGVLLGNVVMAARRRR
ncbi:hypothetical protein EOD42_18725 [Rhodovarius crocodyli]|uniref:Uncharacterized protein n=1 Tax=Rhodovarius crocodyli TaxID=1979269 RepID=A0A437M3G7_9PROT|nr:hypothetical protein [Rhodovarius crocodyli]RVT92251.1 hypothetical protein EOD42_18725 [Rhodovarius crocodyli]